MTLHDLRSQMPNHDIYKDWRRPDAIEGIVIHHSGPGTVDNQGAPSLSPQQIAALDVQSDGRAHVGYHYAIDRAGTVFYLLDEQISGYHAALPAPADLGSAAGQRWKDEWLNGQRFNRRTIAIVLLGWFDKGRQHNNRALPDNQITPSAEQWAALVELVRELRQRHNLPLERVEGHREALARAGFGSTSCPGSQVNLEQLRTAVSSGSTAPVPTGPIEVTGAAPTLALRVNRPLVGLHARNDQGFTQTDWLILQQAKVESLKTMSFTSDTTYTQARQINPSMEFIVRLYPGGSGRGHVPQPQAFADMFRDTIERLYRQFGVLKFEIHNEPNHNTGLEGWGDSQEDANSFQNWYKATFAILRERHPWALLGYPGLAVPHNDLEWLDWNREAIEMSDWLGAHIYWQTPPGHEDNYQSEFWALRFKKYHEKFPHKLIEITEFGNSNGQSPPLTLSREDQRKQYEWWMKKILEFPYLGSAHGFIATSPDPRWVQEGFAWGDEGGIFPVVSAIGAIMRAAQRPEWYYAFSAKVPAEVPPGVELTFPITLGNGGRLPWIARGTARSIISAKWMDGSDREVGQATWALLPHDMAPGEQIALRLKIRTPDSTGAYRLRLAVFHNGQQKWLHHLDNRTAPDYFDVRVVSATPVTPTPPPTPELAATYRAVTVPAKGAAGATLNAVVEVKNTGQRRWVTSGATQGSIHLGYHWVDAQGKRTEGATRGSLSAPLPTGESAQLPIALRLPDSAGRYTLQLGMVSELEQWFDQKLELPFEAETPSAPYGVRYSLSSLASMTVGEKREILVQLQNTGGRAWLVSGTNPVTLVHQWLNEQGTSVQRTPRTTLPHDVQPGETISVPLSLLAPSKAGSYRLRLDMEETGRVFFSQQGNAPHTRVVRVEAAATAPAWGAQWVTVQAPDQLVAGQAGRVEVKLRNTGQQEWDRVSVRLAYHWGDGQPNRVALPADVPPGGEVALGVPLKSPTTAGAAILRLDLFQEGTGWLKVAAPAQRVTILASGGTRAPEDKAVMSAPVPIAPPSEPAVTEAAVSVVSPPEPPGLEPPAPNVVPAEPEPTSSSLRLTTLRNASASDNPERAALALDTNKISAWSSGGPQRPGMWFQFEVGSERPIHSIRVLSNPEQYPRGYTLEGTTDGESWETLRTIAANWGELAITLSPPRSFRSLRLTQTNVNPWHPWSIRAIYIEVERER